MTREEIAQMAIQAARSNDSRLLGCGIDDLAAFAARVAAAQREACAMICDDEAQAWLASYAEGSESRGYEVQALEQAAQRMRSNV